MMMEMAGMELQMPFGAPTTQRRLFLLWFEDYYNLDTGSRSVVLEPCLPDLFGLKGTYRWCSVSVKRNHETAYTLRVEAKHGMLMCQELLKERDTTLITRRIRASDIIWQCWQMCANEEGAKADDLRGIVMEFVINLPTLSTLWFAAEHSTSTITRRNGYTMYTDIDDGFFALMGSVLGKLVARILLDYRSDLSFRSVEKIIVTGLPAKATIEDLESRPDVVLLLRLCPQDF